MRYSDETLERLHSVLYEILAETVRVCEECNIQYFIVGGTAIGAYFYDGIIPWDDDADVGMTRENYDRFIKEAPYHLGKDFFLSCYQTEPDCLYYFGKVMKRNTLFFNEIASGLNLQNNIFVDVFPYDKIPDTNFAEQIQKYYLNFWISCYLGKTQWMWKWFSPVKREHYNHKRFFYCLLTKIVVMTHSKQQIYNKYLKITTHYNNKNKKCYNIVRSPNDQIPVSSVLNTQKVKFGPIEVMAPSDLEAYLKHRYGKISKDIPENKKINHAPDKLSFDLKSGLYEKLLP